LATSNQLKPGK